ncbi:MAG: 4-hydroxy-tetrahydrodipicolinate synthase [Actinomycetes bacterium]
MITEESGLGTVITALVTPFDASGGVDTDGFRSLLDHVTSTGSDGVVIAGTTGEAPTLSDDEQIDLIATAVEHVGDRVCVIAGAGANDTAHAVRLTERSAAAGADAILSVTPYYNRPNERGIREHFKAVVNASDLPVILYNIPTRTGTDMSDELCAELAAVHPTIRAIKQARSGVPQPIEGLEIYAGDDERFAAALDAGATGGILVASHIVGRLMREMVDSPERRAEVDARLAPLIAALGVTVNPIPIKAALDLLGLPSGTLRLPLVQADERERATIRQALIDFGLLGSD